MNELMMSTTSESYHSTYTHSPNKLEQQDNLSLDELVESCCNDILPPLTSSTSSSQLNSSSVSPSQLVRFVHSQSSLVSQIDESLSSQDLSNKSTPFTIRTHSMHNTTNLSNITANNISVNNYNVNIHTTNVQQPTQAIVQSNETFNEKQTTEIVTQILKNIKEVEPNTDQQSSITTNYNIHIDSFNFSSTIDSEKKLRVKKEPKALTKIIVKDENNSNNDEFISVPYGWQRKILDNDFVVYLSPTNTILDSIESIRQYLESPNTCKCGLQCPLIVEKVFNFNSMIQSKSWEVTQVLEGSHCRQKSNILEMATLTNCIDSFCDNEQKTLKRRKRLSNESINGNVFVCTNSNPESVVLINNQTSDANVTPTKRPRGRPRKTTVTSPIIAQLAVKSTSESTTNHVRCINENLLPTSTTIDTNVLARVPALFDQVKTTTNESTFAVLSGVQNVLCSPTKDSTLSNTNPSIKQVKLNVNALKPDFVRSPSQTKSSNQIDVISLMGTKSSANTIDESKVTTSTESNNDPSQSLMIDFNDPSTTNFLLSAITSGASTDSNTIVNHLFQKAQQQSSTTTTTFVKKQIPILASNIKTCTETTNLLPRTSISNENTDEKKPTHQQIFFINNKPYIIQQKLTTEQINQQKIRLTSTDKQPASSSTLDDGGNCLRLNGPVEPKTLRTLLKGLNSSSFSGVDNLIDTIHQFENTNQTAKASPLKKLLNTEKPQPVRKRLTKKMKQELERQQQLQQQVNILPQPALIDPSSQQQQQQQQWQADFNSIDFSTSWGSDTNLNSLLLNDDFDNAASFDDVSFGDFEPYINGNHDISLSSLLLKSLPNDSLPSVDHLLP